LTNALFPDKFLFMVKSMAISQRKSLIRITLTALFAALIAGGTFISIPIPGTPVTVILQNMYAVLAGLILGPVLGAAASGLYLLAGLIGAPIFPRANAGIAFLIGPTGGFILGFPLGALLAGLITSAPSASAKPPLPRLIIGSFAGFLALYAPGVIQFKTIMEISWQAALQMAFLPFIAVDAAKAVFAVLISRPLRRIVADSFAA
jgi:biotin transport system substrate-specific component